MRALIIATTLTLLALLVGCNSQEGNRQAGNSANKAPSPPPPAASLESARRITAQDLHSLWQKDEVLIVDTRNEVTFKQGHIKGSILIPTNEFASRADELPKSKMIVTYCT